MKRRRLSYGVRLLGILVCMVLVMQIAGSGPAAAAGCSCGCGGTPRPACAHSCGGGPCTGGQSAQASTPSAAKGCTCGCGGTPRPACAHSCGGDPCTGGALKNSRIIVGEVVENRPATFSVVGSNGNALTGFVVDFDNGQKATTDSQGRATFLPTARKLMATIPDVLATGVEIRAADSPVRDGAPRCVSTGNEFVVNRKGFFEGKGETNIKWGDQPLAVLAESPNQAIVYFPPGVPPGRNTLRMETQGRSAEMPLTAIAFSMSADKLKLVKGETTRGRVVLQGADEATTGGVVRLHNLSPDVVSVDCPGAKKQGNTLEVPIKANMIQGGKVEIPFTIKSHRGGGFSMLGAYFDPNTRGLRKCTCGCGGTPRPLCAHTCGGNPCTGG